MDRTVENCAACGGNFIVLKKKPRKTCSYECWIELCSQVKKGKTHTEEAKKNMSDAAFRRWERR